MSVTTNFSPGYDSGFDRYIVKDRCHTESKNRLGSPTIFSPFRLGSQQLKNRLVTLPVYTGYAYPDGRVSPQLIEGESDLIGLGRSLKADYNWVKKGVSQIDDPKRFSGTKQKH